MHGQGGNSIYEMINGSFAFGDTGFQGATSYFYQSNGFPLNQSLTLNLMMLTWQVMGNTKDMAEFRGSTFSPSSTCVSFGRTPTSRTRRGAWRQ